MSKYWRLSLFVLIGLSMVGCAPLEKCIDLNGAAVANSCVFTPLEKEVSGNKKTSIPANKLEEDSFRQWVGEPKWSTKKQDEPKYIALALSGGGSKAAPVAMGVLAGLDDLDMLGGEVDNPNSVRVGLISSVSGGGYAAYYFFSQAVTDRQRKHRFDKNNTRYSELFSDSLLGAPDDKKCDAEVDGKNTSVFTSGLCNSLKHAGTLLDDKEETLAKGHPRQYVVRCTQDVFVPGKCDLNPTELDKEVWGSHLGLLSVNILFGAPFHHVANTVFDSGVNLSPSRYIYESGIGTTYGTTPITKSGSYIVNNDDLPWRWKRLNCPLSLEDENIETGLADGWQANGSRFTGEKIINCRTDNTGTIKPRPLLFSELSNAWTETRNGNNDLPFWVIQATGTKYRSLLGWANTYERDAWLDSFEFTPLAYGSRRYGFVPGSPDSMSVLNAVTSAAAFFDANQQVIDKDGWGLALGAVQHGLDLNWGWDLNNYNVSHARRAVHRVLPLPISWLDSVVGNIGKSPAETDRRRSAFIRLVDGGSSENLSAISALRRGFKTIVIADAAEDKKGDFGDLCYLAKQLEKTHLKDNTEIATNDTVGYRKHFLRMPALDSDKLKFKDHCGSEKLNGSYNLYGSGAPRNNDETPLALLGCITPNDSDDVRIACSDQSAVRIIVIKPMLNLNQLDTMHQSQWKNFRKISACTHGRYLYSEQDRRPLDCRMTNNASLCMKTVPCEVARLMGNYNIKDYRNQFPQTTTVATTANSSASLYASYRELARQQLIGAKQSITLAINAEDSESAKAEFAVLMSKQEGLIPVH